MPIGTLSERSLHANIKNWFREPGDKIEKKVDGFIIDIVRGEWLIEIQTGNFSAIRRKLAYLLRDHAVHLVHPIAVERWIVRKSGAGFEIGRRRSPKKGRVIDIFAELVRIPDTVMDPNLTIEVLLIREEEIRRDDGKGSRRRKRWSIQDRRLLEVMDAVTLSSLADFQKLLPKDLPSPFTNRDLARTLECHITLAQKMTYTLRRMGAITNVGKRGNATLYM